MECSCDPATFTVPASHESGRDVVEFPWAAVDPKNGRIFEPVQSIRRFCQRSDFLNSFSAFCIALHLRAGLERFGCALRAQRQRTAAGFLSLIRIPSARRTSFALLVDVKCCICELPLIPNLGWRGFRLRRRMPTLPGVLSADAESPDRTHL